MNAPATPTTESSLSAAPLGKLRYLSWALQTIVAVILLQTLFFKFTGAPESVYIFETLGMEPFGRWGTGLAEMVASILLFIPSRRIYGALLGLGVMAGAIGSHLTVLGIEVQGDGGLLFSMAIVVFVSCAILAWMHRRQLPLLN